MRSISARESVKSNTARFSARWSRPVDFGTATTLSCRTARRIATCAGVFPRSRPVSRSVSSRTALPRPSGLAAASRTPLRWAASGRETGH